MTHDTMPEPVGEAAPMTFTYMNWRGEVGERSVYPIRIEWGATEWHPEPQWLIVAYDIGKGAERSFAFKNIVPEVDLSTLPRAEAAERERDEAKEMARLAHSSDEHFAVRSEIRAEAERYKRLYSDAVDALIRQIPSHRDPNGNCWCSIGRDLSFGHERSCLAARSVVSKSREDTTHAD